MRSIGAHFHAISAITPFVILVVSLAVAPAPNSCRHYTGTYAADEVNVVYVSLLNGTLTARPILWGAFQPLAPTRGDVFEVADRPARTVTFYRDSRGCISSVTLRGFDDDTSYKRLNASQTTVIQLLLRGQIAQAFRRTESVHLEEGVVAQLLRSLIHSKPSALLFSRLFAERAVRYWPRSSELLSTLAELEVGTGERAAAKVHFLRSYELDENNTVALTGLRRLDALPPPVATQPVDHGLSFSITDLLAAPTESEVALASRDIATRDLTPRDVTTIYERLVTFSWGRARVRVVSYSIRGARSVGAIVTPTQRKRPIRGLLVNVKGVSLPNYSPLELRSLLAFSVLGPIADQFIYLVPALEGETLLIDGKSFTSGGNRFDAWDGAADSAVGVLKAYEELGHSVDPAKICTVGQSRGGPWLFWLRSGSE